MKHALIQISLGHGLATTWDASYRGCPRISGEYCDAAFKELVLFLHRCLPPRLLLTWEEIVCQILSPVLSESCHTKGKGSILHFSQLM